MAEGGQDCRAASPGAEHLASVGDPSGGEFLVARVRQQRHVRRLQVAGLALGVIAGSVLGFYGLSLVFGTTGSSRPGSEPSPLPIVNAPNGRIIFSEAAAGGLRLVSIEPDGSDRRLIPTPPGDPWLPTGSPDGTKLAVAIFRAGDRSVWVIDEDGSNAQRIASADDVSQPSWSPGGDRIAYSAEVDAQGTSSVHVVNADGSDDHVIYTIAAEGTQAIFSATFSPNGTKILVDQGTDAEFDILVMDADGSKVRQLTETGVDYDPAWAPDGTRIAFTRQGQGAQSDIYVMNSDGSDPQQLTSGPSGQTNLAPTWSPDGRKIAYVAGVTGGPGSLVVVNRDGTNPATLVKQNVLGLSWQPIPVE